MTYRTETIGAATLYLGDCRDILPTLGKVDAVVTDPPYGLEDWNTRGTNAARGQGRAWKNLGKNADSKFDGHEAAEWDKPLSGDDIAAIMAAGNHKIIWGGNYLLDHLPRTKQMFVWNKGIRNMHFNDCEIAWTSQWREACRVFDFSPASERKEHHPTQKPLPLMKWCIGRLPDDTVSILDPYMGSGTTGVAAVQMGRTFIGIEREPKYFDIACKRIEDAQRQGDMFIERTDAA
jgi:site-specific DNA-methyltransferase (adenine-specific)